MSAKISTKLDDATAVRAREIAQREHRSMSNHVANAVAVFTDLPKDLRDALLGLRAVNDGAQLRALTHELSALAARARFDLAARDLANESGFTNDVGEADDVALLESASKLTRAELRRRG
jgi:predicted transcriptional regulator